MKISENWLRTWVNPAIDSDKLSDQLTMLGLGGLLVHSVLAVEQLNLVGDELHQLGVCLDLRQLEQGVEVVALGGLAGGVSVSHGINSFLHLVLRALPS